MSLKRNTWPTALIICSLAAPTLADSNPEMDKFFANEQNLKGFELATANGQMAKGREKMLSACRQAKQKKPALNCDCWQTEMDKISDKEFFFESVLAYRQYKERVQALQEKDKEKFERLKKAHAQRIGLSKRIDQTCGKS
ncbi:hypothetical protein [Sedimenticola sp.]|uniref:hypothetical protein n=1 Tax=Sedimenticola sp. TaxID=1940285 RepID=UPI003D104108